VRGGAAMLDVGGAALEIPAAALEVGAGALVAVRADEILIAVERPRGLSARNVVAARVDAIESGGESVRLRATLDGTTARVWVELTAGAVRELDLGVGRAIFLVIKTRSFRVLAHGAELGAPAR
jgi:molybdate transport system ATP-binding protein